MARPSPAQEGWCAVDNSFGPAATDCRGNFDFTLLFEELILSILPSALFLLIVPYRFLHVYRGPRKVRRSLLQIVKLVSSRPFIGADILNLMVPRLTPSRILLCKLGCLYDGQDLVVYAPNCQLQQGPCQYSMQQRLASCRFSITIAPSDHLQSCRYIYSYRS